MKVTYYAWDSGDWVAAEIDGDLYYEGHSLRDDHWLDILRKAGVEVSEVEVKYREEDGGPTRYGDWDEAPTEER
jgi:hypothetical protein